MSKPEKAQLVAEADEALRALVNHAVLFHLALAQQLGMQSTDVRCLALLRLHGELGPGQLAALTSLTSGAITGVIDRLVAARFVQRAPHPADRRKQVLRLASGPRSRELEALFAPPHPALAALLADADERALIALRDFARRASPMFRDAADRAGRRARARRRRA